MKNRSGAGVFCIATVATVLIASACKPNIVSPSSPGTTPTQVAVSDTPSPPDSKPNLRPEITGPIVGPSDATAVPTGTRKAPMKIVCEDARYRDRFTPGYVIGDEDIAVVDALLGKMSIKDKADQLRGTPKGTKDDMNWKDIFRSPDDPKNGIRGFMYRDGPRGLNLEARCPEGDNCYSTAFPVEIARGAAFDTDLEYRIGKAAADETLASGNTILLAPSINILRHPAWGRAQESYGEDAYLLGKLGTAFIVGVQEYIPACSKHFIANNVENERQVSNALMDEQTLREIYGTAYEMTIRDGGVACVMASYNKVNGTNVAENRHVLTDLLRDDFGFEGFVISDWWALANPFKVDLEPAAYEASAKKSLEAGLDLEAPWSLNYEVLEAMVEKGDINPAFIERSARRILTEKVRFHIAETGRDIGLKKPATRLSDKRSIEGNEAHLELAYEAALKSAVLLKNEKHILPIDKKKVKTIAVLGAVVPYEQRKYADRPSGQIDFSKDVTIGDFGSSRVAIDPKKSIGPFEGIQQAAGKGVKVVRGNTIDAAKNADFVVVIAGLTPGDEGEEYTGAGDRKSFALDAKIKGTPQNDLIEAAAALGKPMAVVLVGGSVIDMPWQKKIPAVVMSWYPGIQGGRALGDLLFGNKNFSGKLPFTWPNTWDELPQFDPGVPNPVKMDYYLGYRYYDKNKITPLFPFGHGESYSTFKVDNLQVPCADVSKHGVVNVKVDVVNTGKNQGDEIVFLFVSYPETKARRSVKELKGFQRISLEPGQAKQVTIPVRVDELKYWNAEKSQWEVESGPVKIMVGGSAANLPLSDTMTVR